MASFFKEQASSSESDRDDNQSVEKGQDNRKRMADELFDSDDEDEKRVVLTEKEKRFNKMKETISNIK